jgi:hypothetical protein
MQERRPERIERFAPADSGIKKRRERGKSLAALRERTPGKLFAILGGGEVLPHAKI